MYKDVVSAEILLTQLSNPSWVVVDCRFDLKNPDWGVQQYLESHIQGAVYAQLDKDLSGPVISGKTGRHPLPDINQFATRLSSWGVGDNTQVIVYDHLGGAFAARLWWMLRFLGHLAVAVLDGGFTQWQRSGLPLSQQIETRPPAVFIPSPDPKMVVSTSEVEKLLHSPDHILIDARAAERFRGEFEPIDPVAGHIPGAVNRFHGKNLQQDLLFLPADVLRRQYLDLLASTPVENAIVYCGSGVTSCHHLVAMERAGLPGARLYAGSWSEWITDPNRNIAR